MRPRDQSAYSRGRSRGRSRGQGKGRLFVELDAGEAVGELGHITPAARRRDDRGDYFGAGGGAEGRGPVRAKGMKDPVLVTPGIKEIGIPTPTVSQHPGVRPPPRPQIRRTESRVHDGSGGGLWSENGGTYR